MLKAMMLSGALSLGLIAAGSMGPARADSDIGIGLGGYDAGPYYWPVRSGVSCGEGRRIVASAGFGKVSPLDCHGSEYAYRGIRHDGLYKITLRSNNGRIENVNRIRSWDRYGWDGDYDGDNDYSDRGFGYSDGGFASGDYSSGFDDDDEF